MSGPESKKVNLCFLNLPFMLALTSFHFITILLPLGFGSRSRAVAI
jgi:hypothetical protein